MTNVQILRKVVHIAIENGWQDCNIPNWYWEDVEYIKNNWIDNELYFSIIFSHSFAKAFVKYILRECKYSLDDIEKLLLQQMVVEKEPLQYLRKFL